MTKKTVSEKNQEKVASIKGHMLRGSAWMVAMRWSIRGIGLASTIILARLLTPADFGVVAMAMLVIGFLEVLSSFGIEQALISNTEAGRSQFDTAWTFKIIQGTILAALILFLAPFMVEYFSEPRLIGVMQLLALAMFINGFENVGIVYFRKEFDFSSDFKFAVITKLGSFAITLVLALLFRNYWALVAGVVAGRVIRVILSYQMHAYRPKWSFSAVDEMWSFSKWMVLVSVANHIHLRVDQFVIGGGDSSDKMGIYNVSSDLSFLPSAELIIPMSRALFPGYAKLQNEPKRLSKAFLKVVDFVTMISVPASMGMMAVADGFVKVVLGDQWLMTIPVIQTLAIAGIAMSYASVTTGLLVAIGKVRLLALLSCSMALLMTPSLYLAYQFSDLEGVAFVRTVLFMLFAGTLLASAAKVLNFRIIDMVKVIWRPVVAGAIMVMNIKWLHGSIVDGEITGLIWDVAIGVISYAVSISVLWFVSGKPETSELMFVERITNAIGKASTK